ncbi:MAG: hypothetical protein AAFY48_22040 [Bacteroidota bacterium]
MKKWIAIALGAALVIYLLLPTIFSLLGIRTTQVLIYNGNNANVECQFNGSTIPLGPGEARVVKTSRYSSAVVMDLGSDHFEATFGPGQYFVNLGSARLHLMEKYYPWDTEKGKFETQPKEPRDRLLFDRVLEYGLYQLDNCWDCCVLMGPTERPYGYLKPENKDKRFILSSRM